MELSGKLNRVKCLVYERIKEKFEIERLLKANKCNIDTVFEQTVDIDHVVSILRDNSFIILATSPQPVQVHVQAQTASYI